MYTRQSGAEGEFRVVSFYEKGSSLERADGPTVHCRPPHFTVIGVLPVSGVR